MLKIPYTKIIPYPFPVVLDQYFDYEHIAHVHPTTLGEYRVVENAGTRIVYDQHWPAGRSGRRATSRVVQTYQAPGDIWFEFIAGRHRGTKVHSQLRPHPDGTEVSETYFLPWLPDWNWLRRLIAPSVVRVIDKVWNEDLNVGVCIGGWPGIPGGASGVDAEKWRQPLKPGVYRVGAASNFPPGSMTTVHTAGGDVLLVHDAAGWHALHPTCPHTGGPLELGNLDSGCVVCPWHGARFKTATGEACAGPTRIPVPAYQVQVEDGEVVVTA
jgi:nitrite reductase/ring-hydroxylating ferredoxin subunit